MPPLPSERRKRSFYALAVLDDGAFPEAFSVLRDEALPQDVQMYVVLKLRNYPAEEARYREEVRRMAGARTSWCGWRRAGR